MWNNERKRYLSTISYTLTHTRHACNSPNHNLAPFRLTSTPSHIIFATTAASTPQLPRLTRKCMKMMLSCNKQQFLPSSFSQLCVCSIMKHSRECEAQRKEKKRWSRSHGSCIVWWCYAEIANVVASVEKLKWECKKALHPHSLIFNYINNVKMLLQTRTMVYIAAD